MVSKIGIWFYGLPNKIFGPLVAKIKCSVGKHPWVYGNIPNTAFNYKVYVRECPSCKREERSQFPKSEYERVF